MVFLLVCSNEGTRCLEPFGCDFFCHSDHITEHTRLLLDIGEDEQWRGMRIK